VTNLRGREPGSDRTAPPETGLYRGLASDVIPMDLIDRSTEIFMGSVKRQDAAENPVRAEPVGRASPTFPRGLASNVMPYESVVQSTEVSWTARQKQDNA
jgi:hypothetical protein